MFVGFVGFGIGAIRRPHQRQQRRRRHVGPRAPRTRRSSPRPPDQGESDRRGGLGRTRPRPRPARQVGDNFDSAAGDYTADGRRQLTAAATAWDKYVALDPRTRRARRAPDAQAFIALEQPAKAVAAQEILTQIDPTQQTFQNLALLAYQAGQLRKGDLASAKAVELAPKDEQKELKEPLEQAKSQAALQQIQETAPSPRRPSASAPRRYPLRPRPCSSTGRAADS